MLIFRFMPVLICSDDDEKIPDSRCREIRNEAGGIEHAVETCISRQQAANIRDKTKKTSEEKQEH